MGSWVLKLPDSGGPGNKKNHKINPCPIDST